MRTHITILTTLATAAIAFAPASAFASPLLSGYGGPGAGEQQIVGGGLVGGGSGGSRGGGAGPTAPSSSSSSTTAGTRTEGGGPGRSGSARAGGRGAHRGGGRGSSGGVRASAGHGSASPSRAAAAVAAPTLGLSSSEWLLVWIVIAALAGTALLTWRLFRVQLQRESADRGPMNAVDGRQ